MSNYFIPTKKVIKRKQITEIISWSIHKQNIFCLVLLCKLNANACLDHKISKKCRLFCITFSTSSFKYDPFLIQVPRQTLGPHFLLLHKAQIQSYLHLGLSIPQSGHRVMRQDTLIIRTSKKMTTHTCRKKLIWKSVKHEFSFLARSLLAQTGIYFGNLIKKCIELLIIRRFPRFSDSHFSGLCLQNLECNFGLTWFRENGKI